MARRIKVICKAIVVAAFVFHGLFEGNTDRVRRALEHRTADKGVLQLSVEKPEARARFG